MSSRSKVEWEPKGRPTKRPDGGDPELTDTGGARGGKAPRPVFPARPRPKGGDGGRTRWLRRVVVRRGGGPPYGRPVR